MKRFIFRTCLALSILAFAATVASYFLARYGGRYSLIYQNSSGTYTTLWSDPAGIIFERGDAMPDDLTQVDNGFDTFWPYRLHGVAGRFLSGFSFMHEPIWYLERENEGWGLSSSPINDFLEKWLDSECVVSTHAGTVTWGLLVSRWFLLVGFSLFPAYWLVRSIIRWRGKRMENQGLCPSCGYDLRASKERCPECGRAIVAE